MKTLRTASLGSNFAGSYKKECNEVMEWPASFLLSKYFYDQNSDRENSTMLFQHHKCYKNVVATLF